MIIIGHRGAAGLAPENTLQAIEKGLAYHCDAIEIDLRVSKDKVVICHHNPDLKDSDGATWPICDHTFETLKLHAPNLCTLDEVCTVTPPQTVFILEIKPGESVEPIIACIRKQLDAGRPSDTLRIASFDQHILAQVHEQLPSVPLVVNERWSGVRATIRARQLDTPFITMQQRWLWSGFITSMHRGGFHLSAYTLNNPKKARKWARAGLYGVVTDYPDRFKS